MSTAETRPIPLFGNGERAGPQNRLASLLGIQVPGDSAHYQVSTEWRLVDIPFQAQFGRWKSSAADLFEVAVACFIRARIAEANNEITRPLLPVLLVDDPPSGGHSGVYGWFYHLRDALNRLSAKSEEPKPEEERPRPELVWSKALYKARKAAEEFSKETHADR